MKATKFLHLLLFSIIFLFIAHKTKSQGFEGRVIYKSSFERPADSNIPDSIFKKMFNDVTDTGEITVFYIKKDFFKMVTNGKHTTTSLYNPELKRSYSYMKEQPDFCMWSEVIPGNQPIPEITKNLNDTITALNKKCYSITIDYGAISKNKLYYPVDLTIDLKELEKNRLGLMGYFSKTDEIPYKIIMTGNGAVYNLVYTLKEIINENLDDDIFKVPKFKQMIKSPFFQK